ncbi:MAG: hypothetical protein ACRDJE_28635, partial [Dehalococcoidia bacterium]
ILQAAGVAVAEAMTHDELDAIAAALTALRWRQRLGCALGHPEEGMIVLPVSSASLRERYMRQPPANSTSLRKTSALSRSSV